MPGSRQNTVNGAEKPFGKLVTRAFLCPVTQQQPGSENGQAFKTDCFQIALQFTFDAGLLVWWLCGSDERGNWGTLDFEADSTEQAMRDASQYLSNGFKVVGLKVAKLQ